MSDHLMWHVDDGQCEVTYPATMTRQKAAQAYVEDGNWGNGETTAWVTVNVWADDEDPEYEGHEFTIEVQPPIPKCEESCEHDWKRSYVCGNGGGVIITETCSHCAKDRMTDTWATNPDTGEQGMTSITYREANV